MKSTNYRPHFAFAAALLISGLWMQSHVLAQRITGLETYSRTDAPGAWTGSPATDPGWTLQGTGSTGSLSVPANGSLYFAFENSYRQLNTKTFSVEFLASLADYPDLSVGTVSGYTDNGTTNTATVTSYVQGSPHTGVILVNATSTPQPEWESIQITNSSGQAKSIKVTSGDSNCYKTNRSTGANGVPDSQMEFSDHMFAAEGNLQNTTRITQIELFPRNVDVDLSVLPTLQAPPHTGNWIAEFVFDDPNGDPRPHGGVRWISDGMGLAAGELHDLSITMTCTADSSYLIFGFDADVGQYQQNFIDLGDLPWYEDFETHFVDVGAAGWRGWKGWDNDPAFDAPASSTQSFDGINSIRVDDTADIIHEFSGIDYGAWSFSAWQYIPSDFTSGGSGQLRGSHFLLLNTYNDGGPYDWSTALQVDSVDNVMKIFHGDGTNTIDIPYVTDRWAKIQIIIDLEDDWTQIYYDDDLITEYSWTGGVLGNGGGLGEIQCVDLFANGSSPIYYDQLALEPLKTVTADSIDVIVGHHESGQLSDVDQSDDSYLCYQRGAPFSPTFPSIWLEIDGVLPTDTPDTLMVVVESQVNDFGIDQEIQMFNYITGQFESVDIRDATRNIDSVTTIRLSGDITRFVEPGTGNVRTKLAYTDDGSGFFFAWKACIDQFVWKFE